MASKSERESKSGKGGDRAALPFEPKRKREKDAVQESGSQRAKDADKKAAKKAAKKVQKEAKQSAKDETSAVSAKAQARVDDIRAANRKRAEKAKQKNAANSDPDSDGRIPKEVSRRMVRRMATLSIAPIVIGVGIFFTSYYLLSHQIVTFAPIVTLLTTMGCFGLGVVGLTYGMLSASWDEEPGSLVGLDEFKLNFGRIMDARKASKGL
ncbi:MAG: PAM68 family protein [Cyanobacteria bacterium J06576_12]